MTDQALAKKPSDPFRTAALGCIVLGIGGGVLLRNMDYGGPLRDLTRLATLVGIVLLIVAAVRNRRKPQA